MYTCTANDGKLGKQVHVQMELALNIMNINVKVRIQNKDEIWAISLT